MQQTIFSLDPTQPPLELPAEDVLVMPDVRWGSAAEPFTPAFWRALIHQSSDQRPTWRLGDTLLEETAACLLGGYGIPAEVGLAAYRRLRSEGLLRPGTAEEALYEALHQPLPLSNGSCPRYRFARSKARALAQALRIFARDPAPREPLDLRRWLLELPGIGLKTASWIVRNHFDCDDIAILDVHLVRAGELMGLFPRAASLPRDYLKLENLFLEFSSRLGVKASVLDACIWAQMKKAGAVAHAAAKAIPPLATQPSRQHRKPAKTKTSETQLALL